MTTKRGKNFLPSYDMLFLAAWNFFFESHDVSCFADSNAPTVPTIEANHHIAAGLFPQHLDCFNARKKALHSFSCYNLLSKKGEGFSKKGGIFFFPPLA